MDFTAAPNQPVAVDRPLGERLRAARELLDGAFEHLKDQDDDGLVEAIRLTEALGDVVDALRVRGTGEIDQRCDPARGEDRLSARRGCRDGYELLNRLTQSTWPQIKNRKQLDARTQPGVTMSGHVIPAPFPVVAKALGAGDLGVDAAHLITSTLEKRADGGDPDVLTEAEQALVDAATGRPDSREDVEPRQTADAQVFGPRPTYRELVKTAATWAERLDSGARATATKRGSALAGLAGRGLTLGGERDGLVTLTGRLSPEVAATLNRLLSAHLNPAATPDGANGDDASNAGDTAEADSPFAEDRTAPQKRHDAFGSIVGAAGRCAETPTLGGDNAVLVVHVNAEDLDDPEGPVVFDGIDVPGSMESVYRLSCTSAVQKVVFDGTSKVVALGTKERVFNAHQRRAIMARDGECIIPGCNIPGAWCEIHHVIPWAEGGETHVDNGVLLCWWHHHTIETTDWDIVMVGGTPRVKAPEWIDPTGAYRVPPNTITRPRGPYLPPREHRGLSGTRNSRIRGTKTRVPEPRSGPDPPGGPQFAAAGAGPPF